MTDGKKQNIEKTVDKTSQVAAQDEYRAQCNIFRWAASLEHKHPDLALLNASLNGVRLTIGQAAKAKRAGMRRGYPDIFLPVARGDYNGLFIELKVGKNKPTKEQIWWLQRLAGEGYKTCAVWGADAAIEVIMEYLGLDGY